MATNEEGLHSDSYETSPHLLSSDDDSRSEEVFEGTPEDLHGEKRSRFMTPPPSWALSKETRKFVVPWSSAVALQNYETGKVTYDSLHLTAKPMMTCSTTRCTSSAMAIPQPLKPQELHDRQEMLEMASDFILNYYGALNRRGSKGYVKRMKAIELSIATTGTYELTQDELSYGTKLAWRNAPRCVARMYWNQLQLIDGRHAGTTREIFDFLCSHLRHSTNGGHIKSSATVFGQRREGKPDIRIWNSQLISYAGFRLEDGSIIGDPARVVFTEVCKSLGWKGKPGRFVILPWLIQMNGEDPEVYEIPQDLILEVEITHPKYPQLSELGLRWYAVPTISNLAVDCGGIVFPAVIISGWYMTSEIACRNFGDSFRYNCLPDVDRLLNLSETYRTGWKTVAMTELCLAVLHSFETAGVTIQDHSSVSEAFQRHFVQEHLDRGGCPSDWVWLVPPVSGSACPLFHQEMLQYYIMPAFLYQVEPWKTHSLQITKQKRSQPLPKLKAVFWSVLFLVRTMMSILSRRQKVTILYGTETGRSKNFALKLCDIYKIAFDVRVLCMDDYLVSQLQYERLLLMVASTTSNGDPPQNARDFARGLLDMIKPLPQNRKRSRPRSETLETPHFGEETGKQDLKNVKFSVFALGSRAYPAFCAFGRLLNRSMSLLGAKAICPMGEGDELEGQEAAFDTWAQRAFTDTVKQSKLRQDVRLEALGQLSSQDVSWQPGHFRLQVKDKEIDIFEGLSKIHGNKVYKANLVKRKQLQAPESERKTMLICLQFDRMDPDLTYIPGDHVYLFPENPKDIVERVLVHFESHISPDQPVQTQYLHQINTYMSLPGSCSWKDGPILPVSVSLRTALSKYLDITRPPTQALLKALKAFATKEQEIDRLHLLSTEVGLYERWVEKYQPNLAELLETFPSIQLPANFVLSQLPVLKPRIYSISSSQSQVNNEVHLTVGLTQYYADSGAGRHRIGVCSGWLDALPEGTDVAFFMRSSADFQLPMDQNVPLLLIATGTGIAPIRGFWQHRQKQLLQGIERCKATKPCDISLYFGCRQEGVDDIYREEIEEAIKSGVFTDVQVALSRQPDQPKTYVQNLLNKDASKIAEAILTKHAHVYICGDVRMSEGVNKALEVILVQAGQMSVNLAKALLLNLRETGRYHEEIFGPHREVSVEGKMHTHAKMRLSSARRFLPNDIFDGSPKVQLSDKKTIDSGASPM